MAKAIKPAAPKTVKPKASFRIYEATALSALIELAKQRPFGSPMPAHEFPPRTGAVVVAEWLRQNSVTPTSKVGAWDYARGVYFGGYVITCSNEKRSAELIQALDLRAISTDKAQGRYVRKLLSEPIDVNVVSHRGLHTSYHAHGLLPPTATQKGAKIFEVLDPIFLAQSENSPYRPTQRRIIDHVPTPLNLAVMTVLNDTWWRSSNKVARQHAEDVGNDIESNILARHGDLLRARGLLDVWSQHFAHWPLVRFLIAAAAYVPSMDYSDFKSFVLPFEGRYRWFGREFCRPDILYKASYKDQIQNEEGDQTDVAVRAGRWANGGISRTKREIRQFIDLMKPLYDRQPEKPVVQQAIDRMHYADPRERWFEPTVVRGIAAGIDLTTP